MREEDLALLSRPFEGPPPQDLPQAFAEAVGASTPASRMLAQEVYRDLDDVRFGIGWWSPHPDTRRRILISDYLFACCDNIETNMVEARLHLLEAFECWGQEESHIRVVYDDRGMPRPAHAAAHSPADYLSTARGDMHVAGFFSSLIASLDCLGAAIVGVTALPTEIVRSRLDRARKALRQVKTPTSEGGNLQVAFRERLDSIVDSSGPPGWLEWVDDFRNTSIHRARRLQACQVKPHRPLLGSDGRPLPSKVDLVFHLPRDPGRTEIEALCEPGHGQVLQEDGKVTMHGAMTSAKAVIDAAGSDLLSFWRARRSTPTLLTQPLEQWPEARLFTTGFAGYAPGSEDFQPALYSSNPQVVQRLMAASLMNQQHKNWNAF